MTIYHNALKVECAIRDELKREITSRWKAGKRDRFLTELRAQLRTQCFRIAALRRIITTQGRGSSFGPNTSPTRRDGSRR